MDFSGFHWACIENLVVFVHCGCCCRRHHLRFDRQFFLLFSFIHLFELFGWSEPIRMTNQYIVYTHANLYTHSTLYHPSQPSSATFCYCKANKNQSFISLSLALCLLLKYLLWWHLGGIANTFDFQLAILARTLAHLFGFDSINASLSIDFGFFSNYVSILINFGTDERTSYRLTGQLAGWPTMSTLQFWKLDQHSVALHSIYSIFLSFNKRIRMHKWWPFIQSLAHSLTRFVHHSQNERFRMIDDDLIDRLLKCFCLIFCYLFLLRLSF